jgi:ribosome biogenesis GTPase
MYVAARGAQVDFRRVKTARVVLVEKGGCFLEDGELVVLPKKLRRAGARPAVGDYVVADAGAIVEILPRRTKLSRKAAGESATEQMIAANIDKVFIVSGLDGDYNPRRIERYVVAVRSGGAAPIVLLNKVDLCPEVAERIAEIAALGVPVHAIGAKHGEGLAAVAIGPEETVCFVGSSGAGKSTLVNRLLGREAQRTQEVRAEDDRGRHTTSSRELFAIPGGGFLIDTPGMRELALWEAEPGLAAAFADVQELARTCRFNDCRHLDEPGCAVRDAIPAERLAEWRKLTGESNALEQKRAAKRGSRAMKSIKRDRG